MHFLRYLFTALITTSAAVAQLPEFRYVGLPQQPYATGETVLMNDRIVIHSDDETSTWSNRRKRHYVYHAVTGKWSPLPNLDTIHVEGMPMRAINDSLIGFDLMDAKRRFVLWNIDTDEQIMIGYHTIGAYETMAVHPTEGCVQVEYGAQVPWILKVATTTLRTGEVDARTVAPPSSTDRITAIWPYKDGGFWVGTYNGLWWTKTFDSYQQVASFSTGVLFKAANDGSRIHVWKSDQSPDTILTFNDPSKGPERVVPFSMFANYYISWVDDQSRVWTYVGGVEDGFRRASSEDPDGSLVTRFDRRTVLRDFYTCSSGLLLAATLSGYFASDNDGATWTKIPLPHATSKVLDSRSHLAPVDDGSIVIAGDDHYLFGPEENTFTQLIVEGGNNINRWIRRDEHWLGIGTNLRPFFSDERGFIIDSINNAGTHHYFMSGDEHLVRWRTPAGYLRVGSWTPGAYSIAPNEDLLQRYEFVSTVQRLSNGKLWLGGDVGMYTYSNDGTIDNALEEPIPGSLQPFSIPMAANEIGDSLVVIYNLFDFGSIPLSNLGTFVRGKASWMLKPTTTEIIGHDGRLIAIQSDSLDADGMPDSLVIASPDMSSVRVRRFENVTEDRVYDIAYDSIHRVYYALTERGLYRSDPVVSSVASDVQRPSSGIPLETTWYNTLGEHVTPPTTPGLYLKIMIDDTGRMVTEKVAIP